MILAAGLFLQVGDELLVSPLILTLVPVSHRQDLVLEMLDFLPSGCFADRVDDSEVTGSHDRSGAGARGVLALKVADGHRVAPAL